MQETRVWTLVWEDPTCQGPTNWATHSVIVPQLLSLCSRASSHHTEARTPPAAWAPQKKPHSTPSHWSREQPLLSAAGEKSAQQRRPSIAKNEWINKKEASSLKKKKKKFEGTDSQLSY